MSLYWSLRPLCACIYSPSPLRSPRDHVLQEKMLPDLLNVQTLRTVAVYVLRAHLQKGNFYLLKTTCHIILYLYLYYFVLVEQHKSEKLDNSSATEFIDHGAHF